MLSYIQVILSYVVYAFVLCSVRIAFPPPLGAILRKSLIKAFCERTSRRLRAGVAGSAHPAAATIRHVPPFPWVSFTSSWVSFAVAVLDQGLAVAHRPFQLQLNFQICPALLWSPAGLITPHFVLVLLTPLENKCPVTPQSCSWRGWGGNVLHPTSAPAPHGLRQQHHTPPPKITSVLSHKQSLR